MGTILPLRPICVVASDPCMTLIRFGLLSNCPHSSWPMYYAINDLPREERYLQRNVICICIAPGPTEPNQRQMEHCLEPATKELALLNKGVRLPFLSLLLSKYPQEFVWKSMGNHHRTCMRSAPASTAIRLQHASSQGPPAMLMTITHAHTVIRHSLTSINRRDITTVRHLPFVPLHLTSNCQHGLRKTTISFSGKRSIRAMHLISVRSQYWTTTASAGRHSTSYRAGSPPPEQRWISCTIYSLVGSYHLVTVPYH
jgi:hypothetical protein